MALNAINSAAFQVVWSWSHKSGLLDAVGVLFAEYVPYLMVLAVIFFMATFFSAPRARMTFFIEALLAVILSRGIITETVRFFYHHLRPFEALHFDALISESGYSFPSGHAAAYFALATTIFLFSRNWGILYFVVTAINGFARVYVGVHWPFDIIGGLAVGILSALFIRFLLKPYVPKPSLHH